MGVADGDAPSWVRESRIALLLKRLEQVFVRVNSQPTNFKFKAYLSTPLEDLKACLASGRFALQADYADLFLTAAQDAVDSCLIVLALLEDRTAVVTVPMRHEAMLWPWVALQRQVQRLTVLQALFKSAKTPSSWDPSSLFVGGAMASFWQHHFPGRVRVPAGELVAALGASYEPLQESERRELFAHLRPGRDGTVSVADVALVLDGPGGLWRSMLLLISWPELCPKDLLPVLMAGIGRDRHISSTAADLALEKRQQRRSVLLPGWSRRRLGQHRAAFHALQAVGMVVAADAQSEGLLVQFPTWATALTLSSQPPNLLAVMRELIGESDFLVQQCVRVSTARCVADVAESAFDITGPRDLHIELSRVHHRKVFELNDDAKDMLTLQRKLRVLLQNRDNARGDEFCSRTDSKDVHASLLSAHLENYQQDSADSARAVLADLAEAHRQTQRQVLANADKDIRRIAAGSAEATTESQLTHLQADAALADHEAVLLMEVNLCVKRRICTRGEMSLLEQRLVDLEATFAKFRRGLLQRHEGLTTQISAGEAELAELAAQLPARREAARQADDAVINARLELAEKMVPLPAGPFSPEAADVLEQQLLKDLEILKRRGEDLEKRHRRARAQAKKRAGPMP